MASAPHRGLSDITNTLHVPRKAARKANFEEHTQCRMAVDDVSTFATGAEVGFCETFAVPRGESALSTGAAGWMGNSNEPRAERTPSSVFAVSRPGFEQSHAAPRGVKVGGSMVQLVAPCAAELQELWRNWAAGRSSMPHLLGRFSHMAESICRPPNEALQRSLAGLLDAAITTAGSVADTCGDQTASLAEGIFCAARRAECLAPSADGVFARVQEETRLSAVNWILSEGRNVGLPDEVNVSAVLIFDRYVAAARRQVPHNFLNVVALIAIGISLKVHGECGNCERWRGVAKALGAHPGSEVLVVLRHLCRGTLSASQIFAAERKVLRALDYQVSAPSALELVDAFGAHLGDVCAWARMRDRASFLVQLSLGDAQLHYRYPEGVMAAGAISVVLQSLGQEKLLPALFGAVASCDELAPRYLD